MSAAARAATPEVARSNRYRGYVVGGVVVCAYVIACYYANALLASLP